MTDGMKKRIRILALLLAFAFLLTACGEQKTEEKTEEESVAAVFHFQGKPITLGEVYLYAEPVIEDYDKKYGSDIWAMEVSAEDGNSQNMLTVTRKDIIENIVKVKVLLTKAADYGVSLSEAEKADAEDDTEAFWKNLTDAQIREMEFTRDMVRTCMEENRLAAKVYDAMMADAGIEISDERARETTFFDMYFPCYKENVNGVAQPMDEKEKKEQYDKAVQAYNSLITPMDENTERDPAKIATYYALKDSSYYTMTPDEIREAYGKEISDMLYTLEDGSCSLVTETEYGYHVFYMKALTDREATDKMKAKMEREEKNAYFSKLYTEWLKQVDPNYHYEDSVDFELYSRIEFN
jgi:hypothetical protein